MSSLNLNKVILCGRLCADPELKQTQNNNVSVVSFTLAVNRRYASRNDSQSGPQASTMAAMLNSLQMGFRTLAIQKHSNEVWKLLGEIKGEFTTFEKILLDAQNRLRMVDGDLEKLVGVRTRQINRRLKDVDVIELPKPEGGEELE